jgi:pSer/pThr/pTyr-binding forkhead associated (FHA) protein
MITTELSYKLKRLDDGQNFDIDKASFTVGRDSCCDIRLSEGHPSRLHAQFILKAGKLLLDDLNSTNGTFVNNQRIHKATAVHSGDIIRFSSNEFTLHSNQSADATLITKGSPRTAARPSFIVEDTDADDPDDTLLLQEYRLPSGWPVNSELPESEKQPRLRKQEMHKIDALIAKTLGSHDALYVGALVFRSAQIDTLVYGISIEQGVRLWTIGRSQDCDFSIKSPNVSEIHAELTFSENKWRLNDKKSTNGMRVNGEFMRKTLLEHGSVVLLGDVELIFRNYALSV